MQGRLGQGGGGRSVLLTGVLFGVRISSLAPEGRCMLRRCPPIHKLPLRIYLSTHCDQSCRCRKEPPTLGKIVCLAVRDGARAGYRVIQGCRKRLWDSGTHSSRLYEIQIVALSWKIQQQSRQLFCLTTCLVIMNQAIVTTQRK